MYPCTLIYSNSLLIFPRFAPGLKAFVYVGDKEKREETAQQIRSDRAKGKLKFQVLITTYEVNIQVYKYSSLAGIQRFKLQT